MTVRMCMARAACWKGASEAKSALDDAGHACMHRHSPVIITITIVIPFASFLWACQQPELPGSPPAQQSQVIALQCKHHPAALVLMVQSAGCLRSACVCVRVQPELHGMLSVEEGQFSGLQCMAMRWPNRLKQAAAVCNSLTLINKSQVVGDAADKQAFKAVEACFVVSDTGFCLAAVIQSHVTPASKPGGHE